MTTPLVPSLALVILDGWGLAAPGPGNAISLAETPVFDRLWARYPHTQLSAQGRDVGLPDGQMGNSEVGHLNLGAGAIVKQDLARIDDAIADGSFFENEALLAACERARDSPRGRLHLLGLVSDGGVHSGWEHIEALRRAGLAGGRPRRRRPRLHRRPRHAAARRPRLPRRARALAARRPAGSAPSAAATTRWTATPAGSGSSSPTTRSSTPTACSAESRAEAIAGLLRARGDRRVRPADRDRRLRRRRRRRRRDLPQLPPRPRPRADPGPGRAQLRRVPPRRRRRRST